MIFPLKQKKVIRGFDAHIAAGLGGATDYVADHTIVYSPVNGFITTYQEARGGNWLRITAHNGDIIEFGHLDSYLKDKGPVVEGDKIAISGATGLLTPTSPAYKPHLHVQVIINGIRVDPELYFAEPIQAVSVPLIAINATIPLMQAFQAELLKYSLGPSLYNIQFPTCNTRPSLRPSRYAREEVIGTKSFYFYHV